MKYDNGKGVSQDDAEAAKWYREAADRGRASAQYNLACDFYTGKGVAKSAVEAVEKAGGSVKTLRAEAVAAA